jgi:hypothetical protein
MIGLPFNGFLTQIMQRAADLVAAREPRLVELATQHTTTRALAEWIRSLPTPIVEHARFPVHASALHVRIVPPDPTDVERAFLYLGGAELIDTRPVRQLATLDTRIGPHTFPIENGVPVVLDPRVPKKSLDDRLAIAGKPAPIVLDRDDAIDFVLDLGTTGSVLEPYGLRRSREARTAIRWVLERGAAPSDPKTIDEIAWLLDAARRRARDFGGRAIVIAKAVTFVIAELVGEGIQRTHAQGLGQNARLRRRAKRRSANAIGTLCGVPNWADFAAVNHTRRALLDELWKLGVVCDVLARESPSCDRRAS